MLSNSCLVLPAVVKQQQEEISRNHIQSLFAISVTKLNGSCLAAPIMTYHATSCKEGGEGGIRHYFPYLASTYPIQDKEVPHSFSEHSLSLSLSLQRVAFFSTLPPSYPCSSASSTTASCCHHSVGSRLLPYKWLLLLPTMHQPTNHVPPRRHR